MEFGSYMKHCKVEVYLMEFKLFQQSQLNETVTKMFSRGTTVGECRNVVHYTTVSLYMYMYNV